MVHFIGNTLSWIAAIAILPVILLPLALLIGNEARTKTIITWLGLSLAVVLLGFLFSHLAVDLPAYAFSVSHAFWAAGVITLICVFGFAMEPTRIAEFVDCTCTNVVTRTGKIASYFVIAMALMQFAVVILRYVFGVNFISMQESITYMHGAVFLLAGGYALLTDDHVRVDIFYREKSERHKARVNFVGTYLFLFPFCLLILWAGSPYVAQAWSVFEGSTEQSGIQGVFLLKTLIPIFALLLAMAGFKIAHNASAVLSKNNRTGHM